MTAETMSGRKAPKCPIHGIPMVDVRGGGHMHPNGKSHGMFTMGCPYTYYLGFSSEGAVRCSKERTITIPCPDEKV